MTADDIECLRRLAFSVRLSDKEKDSVKRVLVALDKAEKLPPIGRSSLARAAIDAAIERAKGK